VNTLGAMRHEEYARMTRKIAIIGAGTAACTSGLYLQHDAGATFTDPRPEECADAA
jgi:predicted NAD/FAD-binding protein